MILPESGEGGGAGTVNIHALQMTQQTLSMIKQLLFELEKNKQTNKPKPSS